MTFIAGRWRCALCRRHGGRLATVRPGLFIEGPVPRREEGAE